ncbi:MAG: hypothetical protein LQ337_004004 [Flavoplaca oasis]|nr:MAG: hypothetical protein LQ337_004004 [Flavoplaca oasis]
MVNPGKPSGACELCRKRRIKVELLVSFPQTSVLIIFKCDEAKPACSYCRKKDAPCCFPKSDFEVVWRDQNQVACKAVRRRINVRDKSTSEDGRQQPSTELVRRDISDVPRVLPQDHEQYALTFFFDTYLRPSTLSNHQRGFFGCVSPALARAGPSSVLWPAVNACAQVLLEAWSFLNPNAPQSLARPYYVQAIAAIRRHLQNAEDIDDDVLLATLLLDMYDRIRSFCRARPHKSPHIKGSAAMIENRRNIPITSKTSPSTLMAVRSRIVDDALKNGEPIPTNVLTWTPVIQNTSRTAEIELEAINIEVANLQVSAVQLKTPRTAALVPGLLAKAIELDRRLIAWTATIPDEWVPTHIWDLENIPHSIREAGFYGNHCTVHRSIWTADTLNLQCISRITVGLVILTCLEHVKDPATDITRMETLTILQSLADTVCASIPFHLGDRTEGRRIDDKNIQYPQIGDNLTPDEHYVTAAAFGGIFLMHRFVELLKVAPLLRPGQLPWILGQMGRIQKIYMARPT